MTILKTLVKTQALPNLFKLPEYATPGSAGLDIYAAQGDDMIFTPGEVRVVKTGFAMELRRGHEAQIRSRSGMSLKHGMIVLNSPGTIDSDYRGEIGVIMKNTSDQPYVVKPGDKIAQMVIAEYIAVDLFEVISLEESDRGSGGFGSTGR